MGTKMTIFDMNESYIQTLLRLRLIVGYLGERAQYAWWPTAFYDGSSHLFLEPVFSRTSRLAQYCGVVEAARRLHDEHLSVGCYHLFRLPEEVEQDLHGTVKTRVGDDLYSQVLQSKVIALNALKQMAREGVTLSVGPTIVGGIVDLDSNNTLKTIAAAYLLAFTENTKTFPYVVG